MTLADSAGVARVRLVVALCGAVGGAVGGAAACGAAPGQVANPGMSAMWAALCGSAPARDLVDDRAAPEAELAAFEGQRIVAVELVGAPTLAEHLRPAITIRRGDALSRDAVSDELRRLWQLGLLDDASARAVPVAGGVRLELAVRERGLVGAVVFDRRGDIPDRKLRRLRSLVGVIDDPGRIGRTAARLEEELRTDGHWKAQVTATRRRGEAGQVSLCVVVAPGPRYVIDAVEFPGAKAIAPARLAGLVAQNKGAINARGGAYRADLLDMDLLRIQAEYYDIGHVEIRVGTPVAVVDDRRAQIRLAIPVTEGKQFVTGTIAVTGVDANAATAYVVMIGLVPGAVFSRSVLAEGLERIRAAERKAGRPGYVTPLTQIDVEHARIAMTVEIER